MNLTKEQIALFKSKAEEAGFLVEDRILLYTETTQRERVDGFTLRATPSNTSYFRYDVTFYPERNGRGEFPFQINTTAWVHPNDDPRTPHERRLRKEIRRLGETTVPLFHEEQTFEEVVSALPALHHVLAAMNRIGDTYDRLRYPASYAEEG